MMEEVRQLVSEGKTVSMTVKGHSMSPFIVHLRDELTLGPFEDADIRRGTVALVRDIHGNYLIHRILKRKTFTLPTDTSTDTAVSGAGAASSTDIIGTKAGTHTVDRVLLQGDGNIGQQEVAELPDVIAILYSIQRKGKTYQVYPRPCLTWRIYSRVWLWLTPLRRYLLGAWRRLRKIF